MENEANKPQSIFARWRKLPWPEKLTINCLFAAAVSLIFFGGIVSALCLFVVAAMGWTPSFVENAAKGKPTLGNKGRIFVGGMMAVFALIMLPRGGETAPKSAESTEANAVVRCDFGSKKTEMAYMAGRDVDLHVAPNADAATVPWEIGNDKVPYPMRKGRTVQEHCRVGEWSKIHIPSADYVRKKYGWVPSSALRKVKTRAYGRRVYTEDDFDWPEDSAGLRTAAVKVMNRIMDERRECEALDQENLVLNRTAKGKAFSVPCFTAGEMLSFDFVSADATNGRSFAKVEPMDKFEAVEACKSAVLSHATHPSTVDFPSFDYDFRAGGEGRTQMLMSATAKNAFNLELTFDVQCDFDGRMLTDFAMSEAQ